MKPACPFCYRTLPAESLRLRCVSGRCQPAYHQEASHESGFERHLTFTWVKSIQKGENPHTAFSGICQACMEISSQEVCPYCFWDIPNGWRSGNTVKLTVAGARGAGKSVYITVLVQTLRRLASSLGWSFVHANESTQNNFEREYYEPMFGRNQLLQGTRGLEAADAYQREPLIWRLDRGGSHPPVYIVIRDIAGEELEAAGQPVRKFDYFNRADLTMFLFDPMRLPSVVQALDGIIPAVDEKRLGTTAQGVLPCLLAQMENYTGRFAMVVAKFDALQQMTVSDNRIVNALANPAAMFNRDSTFIPVGNTVYVVDPERFKYESEILDQEIRSLLSAMNEKVLTQMAENALKRKNVPIHHFAVSSLGDTPEHENRLTVRGISPFRVLDPLLWVLNEDGLWR